MFPMKIGEKFKTNLVGYRYLIICLTFAILCIRIWMDLHRPAGYGSESRACRSGPGEPRYKTFFHENLDILMYTKYAPIR
jgi:hypothetical protein